MDHVLGRNPMSQSYVTGYGARVFQNAHHRFWAHAVDPSLPVPPPGIVASGPDAALDGLRPGDPLSGCSPAKCWRDDASAYSMTEVAINWNAPLAWLAAWLAEMGTNPPASHPGITGMLTDGGTEGGAGSSGSGGAGDASASRDGAASIDGGVAGEEGAGASGSGDTQSNDGGCACGMAGSTRDVPVAGLGLSLAVALSALQRAMRRRPARSVFGAEDEELKDYPPLADASRGRGASPIDAVCGQRAHATPEHGNRGLVAYESGIAAVVVDVAQLGAIAHVTHGAARSCRIEARTRWARAIRRGSSEGTRSGRQEAA